MDSSQDTDQNIAPNTDSNPSSDTTDAIGIQSSDQQGEQSVAPQQEAPADALSRTPHDLEEDRLNQPDQGSSQNADTTDDPAKSQNPQDPNAKKTSSFKKFLKKVNLYFLIFLLLVAIGVIVTVVNYLNSKKETPPPVIASQELTEEALRGLANKDASVGNTSHTLNIQGNAVIAGQTLMRGNLDVAGNLQTGGSIQGPTLTISGTSNLGETQINSLQVANNTAVQGSTTLRDLSVSGSSTFNGPMTASQLTITRLIMSGDASLEIPNHISFPGTTPARGINSGTLGSGGTASIAGSDTSGTININTGNNPSPGCMVDVTFNRAFPSQPRVIISPIGAAAGQTNYYVDRSTSGFSVCTANAAPANQSFAFDYFIAY